MSQEASGVQPSTAPFSPVELVRELTVDQFGRPLTRAGRRVIRAGIPAWHPRNDGEGGAGGDGDGGDGAQVTDGGNGGSPFAAVLEAAVTDRDAVAAALKPVEGKITQRFQEAAALRDQWAPFADMGLSEVGPQGVSEALTLAQLFANPAQAAELVADRDQFLGIWESIGEALGYWTPDGQQPNGGQPAAAAAGAAEGEEPPAWAQPLFEFMQGQQAEKVQSAADQHVNDQLAAIKSELPNGAFDSDPEKAKDIERRILQLSHPYALAGHEDAIAKGFADFQAIRGDAERGLVERKENQPPPAGAGGPAATERQQPKSLQEAKAIAARRLAATA